MDAPARAMEAFLIFHQPIARMKTLALATSLALAFTGLCLAQTPDPTPEKAAVQANDRAYEAAYAKADAKALADFFADDADFTTEDGITFSGRAEIEKSIRAAFL